MSPIPTKKSSRKIVKKASQRSCLSLMYSARVVRTGIDFDEVGDVSPDVRPIIDDCDHALVTWEESLEILTCHAYGYKTAFRHIIMVSQMNRHQGTHYRSHLESGRDYQTQTGRGRWPCTLQRHKHECPLYKRASHTYA